MTDPVRVKDPISGHEFDVPPSRLVVCPDLVVIDKPTGKTKPRLPLGTPLPGGKVDREREAQKSTATDQPQAGTNGGQSVATEEEN